MITPRYAVTISRAPLEARFEIAGSTHTMIAVLQASALPVPEVPSTAATGDRGIRVVWVGPRRMILSSSLDEGGRIGGLLRGAVPAGAALVVADVTGSTVTFLLTGHGIDEVLAQGFAHDLSRLADEPGLILATDGWGTAALVEQRGDVIAVTVDATISAYIEHMLSAAAGLPASSLPGVMQAPPPPIKVGD